MTRSLRGLVSMTVAQWAKYWETTCAPAHDPLADVKAAFEALHESDRTAFTEWFLSPPVESQVQS